MTLLVLVRKGCYQDSARLMQVSRELSAVPGVVEAVAMMGTEANRRLLADAGFDDPALAGASPLDMVVAVRAQEEAPLASAREALEALLSGRGAAAPGVASSRRPASVLEALDGRPDASLVSVAVPGPYAAFVAHRALDAGRSVFLFSDNVAVEDEVRLKRRAARLGLLVMGPDCGTAILSGVGLGFANRVARGPVGIVGPSGTGLQELSCLLDRMGLGISHAIGTGSRDLSAEVDGLMTEVALALLAADPSTRCVALVAKHPAEEVAARIHGVLARLTKPAVVRYLGDPPRASADGVVYAASIDEAAETVAAWMSGSPVAPATSARLARPAAAASGADDDDRATVRIRIVPSAPATSGRLVGLFGGGSLAAEARWVLGAQGVRTVVPAGRLRPDAPLPPGHLVVDTGDDAYTVGRPHPMVDQSVRCELVRAAGADPSVGVLLFDLVLGDGAHPDPAPELANAVADAHAARAARGGAPLAVIASVCGARRDRQGIERQEAVLRAAGVHVETTAARAARLAADLLAGVRTEVMP